jgi:CheY-like chemotaxis protein
LILLDIMFAGPPGPDGIELSRQLNQDPDLEGVPVIILSGVRKVLDYPIKIFPDERWMPVKAFLEKPIKPDKLLAEIEKVLGPRG